MYEALGEELILFVKTIWYGSFLAIVYDMIRISRNCISHKNWFISMEDFLYWIAAGFYAFSKFFQENAGQLRGYFFVGLIMGAAAWHWSLSSYVVAWLTKIWNKMKIICIWLKWLKNRMLRCRLMMFIKKKIQMYIRKCKDRGAKNEKTKQRKQKESCKNNPSDSKSSGDVRN